MEEAEARLRKEEKNKKIMEKERNLQL